MMMEQQQVDISKVSDLELAELLVAQMSNLMQTQANVTALQAELQRRKAAITEKP
jgi:hypothetical protein